jgi:hypothetical protein
MSLHTWLSSVELRQQYCPHSKLNEGGHDYRGYQSLFYQMNKFFYETVWTTISNRIGFYTANGPNEESVRRYREGTLKLSKQTFSIEPDRLRKECNKHSIEIYPRISRLPNLEDEYEDSDQLLDGKIPENLDQNTATS